MQNQTPHISGDTEDRAFSTRTFGPPTRVNSCARVPLGLLIRARLVGGRLMETLATRLITPLCVATLAVCVPLCSSAFAAPGGAKGASSAAHEPHAETVIDCVAASVDGKPITLQDVSQRLGISRPISTQEFSSDSRAQEALEMLIAERLIEEEAGSRNISVNDAEVDRYMNEVAAKNNMSRTEFESTLSLRQINLNDYRSQVKVDILRSRLMAQISQEGVPVTEDDVKRYVSENPTLTKSGSKVRLRQVVVRREGRSDEDAEARAKEARERIESGRSFEDVAHEYSESPEAADGGLLGVVAEEDLNPQIFEALLSLSEGEVSPVVALSDSYRIFRIDDRFLDRENGLDEQLLADIRRSLSEKKMQEKMQTFFTSDIRKLHYVDHKL